ncbi:ATP-binding cassette [Forsythia ovata]|uniref:ATP-binding cassette n=1 Tax=Forsythia ovata TaxID=205694 RepID=A0ABD1VIX0_9LAMI
MSQELCGQHWWPRRGWMLGVHAFSTANHSDPTFLKCAARGCHRNFHCREVQEPLFPPPYTTMHQPYHRHLCRSLPTKAPFACPCGLIVLPNAYHIGNSIQREVQGVYDHQCPFEAIQIINMPKDLDKDTTHRYGPNTFKLLRSELTTVSEIIDV